MKNKFTTIGIIITTILLAGVAIFTAIRLYQTRNTAVAPNVPSSKPKAQEVSTCSLQFVMSIPTASPTVSASPTATATATSVATPTTTSIATSTSTSNPTATATATVTASPNPLCNTTCTSNSNCPSGLMCYIASGSTTGNCRNTQCLSETDCTCPVATSTATSKATVTATAKATAQPALPAAGTSWPTVLGTAFGVIIIVGSLLLAL